jgi:hypothetical protein
MREAAPTTGLSSHKWSSADPRHLAIALHHANQIQVRKEVEDDILSRIENLLSLPSSSTAIASSPSSADASAFKSAVQLFQPSDYDNLILERNIDGSCGYALCPNANRKEDPKVKFRIQWGENGSGPGGRGREMRIVPKENIVKWCSDECAERAMYIRVQLSEIPAWERTDANGIQILLLEEGRAQRSKNKGTAMQDTQEVEQKMQDLAMGDENRHMKSLVNDMAMLDVRDEESPGPQAKQLAMERGDTIVGPGLGAGRVGVHILENEHAGSVAVSAPTKDAERSNGGSIEGYHPRELA